MASPMRIVYGGKNVPISDDNGLPVKPVTNSYNNEYKIQDYDEIGASASYVGKQKLDGTWLIEYTQGAADFTLRYANESNNGTYTTYSDAWTNRLTLTYELLENLTGL